MKKKRIGSFDKVSMITIVEYRGEECIPVVYTEATDSLNLPSSSRVIGDRDEPFEDYKQFKRDPQIGISEIERRYMKGHHLRRLHKLYETGSEGFMEKHGKVKGTRQDIHYRGFEADEPLKPEDFGDNVKFISLDDLKEKIDNAEKLNEIRMEIGGESYRINLGVIYGVKELEKERGKKKPISLIGILLFFV